MARRPSIASIVSVTPSLSNGHVSKSSMSELPSTPTRPPPMSASHRKNSSKLPNYNANMDPDELFTKHTVSEVKYVQNKLRGDADAKQEELRLMVGERYRDLLQASTSIISIASSSRRVKASLVDAKTSIQAQEEPPLKKKITLDGSRDSELRVLQQLSAHVKLLLDTPEHLWRLMETKKYFSAAWLFLLARVVHQALVREDEDDEEGWSVYGVDVTEQFPLVQRQWDVVSQFRSQISHRATLSLREYNMTHEDTCSALVTLHLLESRPLTETLSILLMQRSKTLNTMLSWPSEKTPSTSKSQANGHAPEAKSSTRPNTVREVRQATQAAVEAVCRTYTTVYSIFHAEDSHSSLIDQVMEHTQSDYLSSSLSKLPAELQLTTQALLQTLPSSTHFSLLPQNIRGYKPYVDINSASVSVPQKFVAQKLEEWFTKSVSNLRSSAEKWISDINSVRDVWNIRTWIRKWILSNSKLKEQDNTRLLDILDDVYKRRVVRIWKQAFTEAEDSFRERLQSTVASLEESSVSLSEKSVVDFLFQAPPLPTSETAGLKSITADSSLQKYKNSVRKRLTGRIPALDGVLEILENCVTSLQKDFSYISPSENDDSTILTGDLREEYHNDARSLFTSVTMTLESILEKVGDSADILVFLRMLLDELSSTSSFSTSSAWDTVDMDEFRRTTRSLHDKAVDRWRTLVVSRILDRKSKTTSTTISRLLQDPTPTAPSPSLIQSLSQLCNSIQKLGVYRDSNQMHGSMVDQTLRVFIERYLACLDDARSSSQTLWDLLFLRKFAELRGDQWRDVLETLDKRSEIVTSGKDSSERESLQSQVTEYLLRTQILFATLLPTPPSHVASSELDAGPKSTDKLASLLSYGVPQKPGNEEYKPAVELAKPSTRFGLLLVPDTVGT